MQQCLNGITSLSHYTLRKERYFCVEGSFIHFCQEI
uniref:Bm192 n=1 Tax=Brugia malayi TaxID=6279 RepID=A0A1I9GEX5_BRUMA|nr:Bm192 [Brugia malayi]